MLRTYYFTEGEPLPHEGILGQHPAGGPHSPLSCLKIHLRQEAHPHPD